ncbi:hypothetical protein HY404_03875 [Candidatus Microgenomates bacterium]|nr:hypothetical protein [Candidatus Microgenomates bacterium]
MLERPTITTEEFNPLVIRNQVVDLYMSIYQPLLKRMLPGNESKPHVLEKIEGLNMIKSLNSAEEFESKLEELGKLHYQRRMVGNEDEAGLIASKMESIERVYECLKFFGKIEGHLTLVPYLLYNKF